MLGYTSMLLQGVAGPVEQPVKRQLGRIESNGRHLLTIINEILDISRIEAGRMPLQLSTFRLADLVSEVKAELEPIIMRSKLSIVLDLPKDLKPITSDRQKVKQILLNLLSNALKFTHHGSVTMTARRNTKDRTMTLSCPTPASASRAGSGQDLRGLPTARQLADARLRRNRPRPLDLPAAGADDRWTNYAAERGRQRVDLHAHAATQGTTMNKNVARPRVLLVDDYPDAREMYSEYLEFCGFEVVEAGNGMEALQRAADENPDIILMDLSLPVMDGWEATRRLKADKRTASIPVVALTGHALAGISEGARKAGCDASSRSRVSRRSGEGNPEGPRWPDVHDNQKGPQERQTWLRHRAARARALALRDRLARWRRSNVERKARPPPAKGEGTPGNGAVRSGSGRGDEDAAKAPSQATPPPRSARLRETVQGGRTTVGETAVGSRGKVRLLHHRVGRSAEVRSDRDWRRSVGRLHRALQEPRGRRLGRAARGARLDARKRPRPRARQRDRDARAHRHPDVVRHRSSRRARTSSSCCARRRKRSATC
jgi:CheY-like chemotaxis protein